MKKNARQNTAPTTGKTKKPNPTPAATQTELGKAFHLTLPLEKVSEGPNGEVFVEGYLARVDTPDKTPGLPEQMDEMLSTPHFEKWVHDTQERSNGLSLFNAREMHSAKAAGRGVEFKHVEGVGYWGRSEVVDPDTKEKVRKGVITSHSVGGHYGKTWIEGGVLRYEAEPIEVSYVDVPMIPGTEFQFEHADGTTEMRKFATVAPDATETPSAKDFIAKYAALRKEGGGYELSPEYARQEAWDIAQAAQVVSQAAQLMISEAGEPEDAQEISAIVQALLTFMQGETNEMETAATGGPSLVCPTCGGEVQEGMAYCPHCGAQMTAETPDEEAETATEDAPEEPETTAENDSEPEAEAGAEEPENSSSPDTEAIRAIVLQVLSEMADANKAERAGELAKVLGRADGLEKSLSKAIQAMERQTQELSGDIAKVVKEHNALEVQVTGLQKTMDSYGPVMRVAPPVHSGPVPSNPEGLPEKDLLKSLLANAKLSPMIRQAYQTRLTELEILETKPLEEPPSFVS